MKDNDKDDLGQQLFLDETPERLRVWSVLPIREVDGLVPRMSSRLVIRQTATHYLLGAVPDEFIIAEMVPKTSVIMCPATAVNSFIDERSCAVETAERVLESARRDLDAAISFSRRLALRMREELGKDKTCGGSKS